MSKYPLLALTLAVTIAQGCASPVQGVDRWASRKISSVADDCSEVFSSEQKADSQEHSPESLKTADILTTREGKLSGVEYKDAVEVIAASIPQETPEARLRFLFGSGMNEMDLAPFIYSAKINASNNRAYASVLIERGERIGKLKLLGDILRSNHSNIDLRKYLNGSRPSQKVIEEANTVASKGNVQGAEFKWLHNLLMEHLPMEKGARANLLESVSPQLSKNIPLSNNQSSFCLELITYLETGDKMNLIPRLLEKIP